MLIKVQFSCEKQAFIRTALQLHAHQGYPKCSRFRLSLILYNLCHVKDTEELRKKITLFLRKWNVVQNNLQKSTTLDTGTIHKKRAPMKQPLLSKRRKKSKQRT